MNAIKNAVVKFVRDEEGVSAIEYAILAVVIVGAISAISGPIQTMFSTIFTAVTTAVTGAM